MSFGPLHFLGTRRHEQREGNESKTAKIGMSSQSARRTFLGRVAQTAGTNVALTAVAGVAGLYMASQLGATGRGRYAAIQAWFGGLTIAGELGLTASTCFHIAREPSQAADWLATSRNVLLFLGVVTAIIGLAVSPVLSHVTSAPLTGFACVFLVMPIMFMAGAWTFAIQALDIRRWNRARLANPAIYAAGIATLGMLDRLTVVSATGVTVAAVIIQAMIAQRLSHAMAHGGRARWSMVRPLVRYGISSFSGSVPYALNAQFDQVVLTVAIGSAGLGNYAVAVSITLVASPLSAAFGSVLMPSLARGATADDNRLVSTAMWGTIIVGLAVVTPIALAAPFLAVHILGPSFHEVPLLVAILAPGAVMLGCNQVLGDILRGRGRPLDVGRSEIGGLIATVTFLGLLVPRFGVKGAAIASTGAYAVSLYLLWRRVRADARRRTKVPEA